MKRRRTLLLPLLLVAALAIPTIVHATSGGDYNTFFSWVRVRSSGTGGFSVGPSNTAPGSKLTGKYAVYVTLDPPSLATTCTNDYFTNSATGSATYNFGNDPDGSDSTKWLGQLALTDACSVTQGTNSTEALSQQCWVKTAGGGTQTTTVVDVKTCTFGTVNGANQKLTLTFEHYK